MSVLDTLRSATPSRKAVTMCVDGALQAEWDAVSDELEDAAKADTDSGSLALPKVTEVVERLDALRDRVKASEVTFGFEKIPWTARLALQAEHPPREGDIADRIRGFNTASYFPALIKASCVSVTGADGETVTEIPGEVWDSLLGTTEAPGSLNMGQVNRLTGAATQVNDGETAVPPSARSLLGSQDSGASLAQPDPGTSPPAASKGGNRRGSPKSNATKTVESLAS